MLRTQCRRFDTFKRPPNQRPSISCPGPVATGRQIRTPAASWKCANCLIGCGSDALAQELRKYALVMGTDPAAHSSSAAKGDYSDGLQTDYRGSELAAQAARGESREPALARYPANQCAAQADDAGLRAGQGPGRIFDHAQRPRRAGRPGTGNPNRLSFHAGIAVPRSGRFRAPRFSFAGRDAKRSRPEYAFRTENSTRGKRAMTSATKPQVRIAPNNPVFDLPVIVGIEEGLFDKAGLDVSFSATYADREKDSAEKPVLSRLKEQMFES